MESVVSFSYFSQSEMPGRNYLNVIIQGVHKVSLQVRKFITKANEETDTWRLLQNKTYIFKFFLRYAMHLYIDTISCTMHIKTILDFLDDRCLPQMFLIVHSSNFYRTLYLPTINFLCHARIDKRDGGSLPYFVLKFRRVCRSELVSINHDTHCAFLSRNSHFVKGSFNSILFTNRVPETQCDRNLDNH